MDATPDYASPSPDIALPPTLRIGWPLTSVTPSRFGWPYSPAFASASGAASGVDDDADEADDEDSDDDEDWSEEEDEEDSDFIDEDDWDDDDELEIESRFLTNIKRSGGAPLPKRPAEGPTPKKAKKPGRKRPSIRERDDPPDTDDD